MTFSSKATYTAITTILIFSFINFFNPQIENDINQLIKLCLRFTVIIWIFGFLIVGPKINLLLLSPIDVCIYFLLFLMLGSTFFSPIEGSFVSALEVVGNFFICYLVNIYAISRMSLNEILDGLSTSFCIVGLFVVVAPFLGLEHFLHTKGVLLRFGHLAVNSNFLSVMGVFVVVSVCLRRKELKSLTNYLKLVFGILILISGVSSGPLFALIICFLVVKSGRKFIFAAVAAALTFFAFVSELGHMDGLLARLRLDDIDRILSLTGRLDIWKAILSAPNWVSLGLGNGFGVLAPTPIQIGDVYIKNAHNSWLSTLAYLGFLGVVVQFCLFLFIYRAVRRTNWILINKHNDPACIHFLNGWWLFLFIFSFLEGLLINQSNMLQIIFCLSLSFFYVTKKAQYR